MFALCADKLIDVIQVSILGVAEIQKRRNFMDAGRGERKAIAQAGLTPIHSDLTRAWEQPQSPQTGMTGAITTRPRL